jgi:hypothetical protein
MQYCGLNFVSTFKTSVAMKLDSIYKEPRYKYIT